MKPDLSIIIPVYNGQMHIDRCLETIMPQRGIDKSEIIIINDGSTDLTPQKLNNWASEYKNIKLINQSNSGVSTARNNGIRAANGEYITFVDIDDCVGFSTQHIAPYMDTLNSKHSSIGNLQISQTNFYNMPQMRLCLVDNYFEQMLELARRNNADVALAGKITFNYDKRYIKTHLYDSETVYDITPESKSTLLKQADCRESANFALYKNQFLQDKSLRFMNNIHLDEDILFCMQAVLHAHTVVGVPDTAYFYNRHNDTASNFTNIIESNKKYCLANLQRFSVLLQDILKYPQYAQLYTHWLKEFSYQGSKAMDFPEYYPSPRCYMCPHTTCTGCMMHDAMGEKLQNNINTFVLNTHIR